MQRSTFSPVRITRTPSAASSRRRITRAVRSTIAMRSAPTSNLPSVPSMKTRKTLGALGALWLAFATTSTAHAAPVDAAPPLGAAQARDPLLTRGRYLVESVGLCADCHTPRGEKGQFVTERWLMGSPLGFQPLAPMPWAPASPQLAGLPTMTEAQAVTFMQTGKRPDGSAPLPPMPSYRFNEADAKAVVAYLKMLAPPPSKPATTAQR